MDSGPFAIFGSALAIYIYMVTALVASQDKPAYSSIKPLYEPFMPFFGPEEEPP